MRLARLAARLAERCGIARRAARSVAPGPAGPGFHTLRSEGSRVWSGVSRDVWRGASGLGGGTSVAGCLAGLGWSGTGCVGRLGRAPRGVSDRLWRGVAPGCGVPRRDGLRGVWRGVVWCFRAGLRGVSGTFGAIFDVPKTVRKWAFGGGF